MTYDVFLSHASEDKQQVVLPLAHYLESRGFRVWLDEFELTVGDSLRRSIDKGLAAASFGVVVLSPDYLRKVWTNRELDGLVARDDGTRTLILPVWHNLTREEVLQHSPTLADKVAVSTERGLEYVGEQIVRAITRSRAGESDTRGDTTDLRSLIDERKAGEVAQLRRQLLIARSRFDLEQVLFKAEEFLIRYPGDPEARLLREQAKSALEDLVGPVFASRPRYARRGCFYGLLGIFLLLVVLLLILRCPRKEELTNHQMLPMAPAPSSAKEPR